jgi:hypothetical protein
MTQLSCILTHSCSGALVHWSCWLALACCTQTPLLYLLAYKITHTRGLLGLLVVVFCLQGHVGLFLPLSFLVYNVPHSRTFHPLGHFPAFPSLSRSYHREGFSSNYKLFWHSHLFVLVLFVFSCCNCILQLAAHGTCQSYWCPRRAKYCAT